MHFAYPGRKSSHPPPYASKSSRPVFNINSLRRLRPRLLAIFVLGVFGIFYLATKLFASSSSSPAQKPAFTKAPAGHPNAVLVTTINQKLDPFFTDALKKNRKDYARRHGYATFFPLSDAYPLGDSPQTWSKIPALRHAMTKFEHTPYFFFLDDHTIITNPSLRIEDHIMNSERLESLMITDVPVVPPDSVIKTFTHLKGERVDFVLTQDKEGLSHNSFILRKGEWSKYLLDAWFDPLYRSYNFQKAERHALEHIVQWHGTLLAKIALVPQNIMNSYSPKDAANAGENGLYKEGDFILNFGDCEKEDRSCEMEMRPYFQKAQQRDQEET